MNDICIPYTMSTSQTFCSVLPMVRLSARLILTCVTGSLRPTTSVPRRLVPEGPLHSVWELPLHQQNSWHRQTSAVFFLAGVPRLFDLIRCKDDKLRLAFWYAMRNTVVANSLDQATRIAYGRDSRFARVVTLSGELIAETGTLSGGGSKPRGGRMKLGSAASSTAGDAKVWLPAYFDKG